MNKVCTNCKKSFPLSNFHKRYEFTKTKRLKSWCKKCHNEDSKKRNQKNRYDALVFYGGNPPKCNCCGENEIKFLAIDHINGCGMKQRKSQGLNIYSFLKRNNYPDGFQVLCHNCNLAKGFYEKCPHIK